MVWLDDIVIQLGSSVAAAAVRRWLSGRHDRHEKSLSLTDLVDKRVVDGFGRRRMRREIESIADAVATRLAVLVTEGGTDIPANERQAALNAVGDAFAAAVDSDDDLFAVDLDAGRLAQLIRTRAADIVAQAALSAVGQRMFDVVLDECCVSFIQTVTSLGSFPARASTEILSRISGQGDALAQVLARLPVRSLDAPAGTQDDDEFRRRYLALVSTELDDVELFGVNTRRFRPRTNLSVAYVSLVVSLDRESPTTAAIPQWTSHLDSGDSGEGGADDESTVSMRVEQALGQSRRTLIRGEAGSGKTTVLRWLAVTAARRGFVGALSDWNGSVPFFVRLRSHGDGRLPAPEQLLDEIAAPLAGLAPDGWVHRQLRSGRALLLVDGVDELAPSRRPAVRSWLRTLLTTFPDVIVVATSRPAAASARWLSDEQFVAAVLERMGPRDVRALVSHWHDAVRDAPDLPCAVDELPRYQSTLLGRLDASAHLLSLATSPLLCAMLCALNLDRRTHIPRDRMSLYAAAVDLLLERRDAERGVAPVEVSMSGRDKLQVLQYLAWRLSVNNRSETTRAEAVARINDRLSAMPQATVDAEVLYEHLVHRSGVVREPAEGRMDFIHRTFQEYLTAREAAEQADVGLLVDKAHSDNWRQIIIMAAGHASATVRTSLLAGILDRADAESGRRRDLIRLVASCLETAPTVEPPDLLDRVQQAVNTLVPPRNIAEARPLAAVGEPMLHRLPTDLSSLPTAAARACVRATALINGSQALTRLASYAADGRSPVQRELLTAWEYFDPREYAQLVLADAPLDHGQAWVSNPALLASTVHLRQLTDLTVQLHEPADLRSLSAVKAMKALHLYGGATTGLSALRDCADLWDLRVHNDRHPADPDELSSLTQLRWLMFSEHSRLENIRFVRGLTNLSLLQLDNVESVRDFTPLDGHDVLTQLALGGPQRNITTLAVLAQLILLALAHAAEPAGGLAGLVEAAPQLIHLELDRNDWVRDLTPLQSLPQLYYLCLRGSQITDLRPLAAVPGLEFVDLIDCPNVRSVAPLAELPHLRRVWIRGVTPGLDLGTLRPLGRALQETADRRRLNREMRTYRAPIVQLGPPVKQRSR